VISVSRRRNNFADSFYFYKWKMLIYPLCNVSCFSHSTEQLRWKNISAKHLDNLVGLTFSNRPERDECAIFKLIALDYDDEVTEQKLDIELIKFKYAPISIRAKLGHELDMAFLNDAHLPYLLTCTRSGLFWLTRPLLTLG
jgi:hypothetical protein